MGPGLHGRNVLRQRVQRIPDGGEGDRAPGFECGDDGLDERERICAAAHRLPDQRRNPIAGTYGINLQQGDGNTLTGGDVEGCSTALHLGANAQNTRLRVAQRELDQPGGGGRGSAYNNWMTAARCLRQADG